ncbi:nitrogen fixation protein NifZ [Desulfurispirillum indicum]|uniref:NifZ family protein n=1 Tax=Desulfurispirillum indicum (strain ATCC BAA-1389 / DSM 22839 / S5) TaxID=653733 RepID=E6W6L6_DESIS|nr:nitrogen fixation protein NifZ [Desulfurispirillum indicum]ADU65016.1 NifZ family protein [Desulfurispirillum indicum S5]UCZ56919.1 nitrogen fixation protein NifZ [Desulfurispirillum indicum]
MEFRVNQRVRVNKDVRNDGTCGSCKSGCVVAHEGDEGFVREVTEFLFRPAVVVHFLEKNKVIGFRPEELELVEDYNPDTGEWEDVSSG